MAEVIQAVRTYILGQSSVTDLIGQRLYLHVRQQGSDLPSATIRRTSETHVHKLTGRSGLVKSRLEIECFSDKAGGTGTTSCSTVAEAIYKCGLDTIKGVNSGVNIRGITVEDGRREYEIPNPEGGDDHIYVAQFDLMVSYLE